MSSPHSVMLATRALQLPQVTEDAPLLQLWVEPRPHLYSLNWLIAMDLVHLLSDRENTYSVKDAHLIFVKHRAGLDLRGIYPLGEPFFIWGDNNMPPEFKDNGRYNGAPRLYLDSVNLFGHSFITGAVVHNLQQECLWAGDMRTVISLEDRIISGGIDISLDTARATDQINECISRYRFDYKLGIVVGGLKLPPEVGQLLAKSY